HALLLPGELVGFDFGGAAHGVVDLFGDLPAGLSQCLAGGGDGSLFGAPVAAVGDVPGGDAAAPAPAARFEDWPGPVAFAGAFDHGAFAVSVRNGQHPYCLQW